MRRSAQVVGFVFLVALAIQARVFSSGNLTPWWPTVFGVAVGAAYFALQHWAVRDRSEV
jgi:protein-S-isoprenylcysteine O-methyltransferase Ste14